MNRLATKQQSKTVPWSSPSSETTAVPFTGARPYSRESCPCRAFLPLRPVPVFRGSALA